MFMIRHQIYGNPHSPKWLPRELTNLPGNRLSLCFIIVSLWRQYSFSILLRLPVPRQIMRPRVRRAADVFASFKDFVAVVQYTRVIGTF